MTNKPITEKENLLRVLNHEQPLWLAGSAGQFSFGFSSTIEKGSPTGNGYDGFGVHWTNLIPEPNNYVITDITKWESQLKLPDVDSYDFASEYAPYEPMLATRDEKLFVYGSGNGPFERLAALMGFEQTLCAMYEEPEAVKALVERIVDFKIEMVKKISSLYHPDAWCSYDDVATANNLFMSPEKYRELIKPATQRYYDAVRAEGMMPFQHVCGHWEAIIEDYIDMGVVEVTPVQPVNDIAALLKKYGDVITIQGGYDTSGKCASVDFGTDEMVREEVRRCIDEYAVNYSYIFGGFVMGRSESGEVAFAGRSLEMAAVMNDEFEKYSVKFNRF